MMEQITDEILRVVDVGFTEVLGKLTVKRGEPLLRRFRENYANLKMEDIAAIQQAMGHHDDEDKPCPVCRIMAQKEYELGD